jgi:hypothetical protein|tara:strand:+ start:1448 stop:2623 length:1176 start_codon:yes stop_codon:yes gene_type:complete
MTSLAEKLRQRLFGQPSASALTNSAPIRNSRQSGFTTDPFEGTEQNKYAYGTLRYPDNLGEFEFGHYLLFHIFEISQSKYVGPQSETQEINLSKYGMGGGVAGGKAKTQKKINKQEHNLYSPSVAYSNDASELNDITRDTTTESGGSVSRALRQSGRLKRSTDTIALYLPPNIKQSVTANYKNSETGLAGVLGADLIGASNVDDLLNRLGTQGTFNTLRDALTDTLGVKFAASVTDFVTGGDLEGVIRKGTQRALNPALEAIFQSVNFREFSFSFRFTPRNERELASADSIIKMFKFHMLPERVAGQKIGRHLLFPSEFEIQYMFQGTENTWYPFVKPCVLTSLNVDYGPGGESQHFRPNEDGKPAPTEMNLTLNFTETEIITKESVVEGY